jgi:hypothetical protein
MEAKDYNALSWIPWKRMNKLIPIRKSQIRANNKSRMDSKEKLNLPRLTGRRILVGTSRNVSPKRLQVPSIMTKTFSPVLMRGRTSQFQYRDAKLTS